MARVEPALPRRGLHLDPCRHYIAPGFIVREILPRMAVCGVNTLHLHLSDDQAVPVEFLCEPQVGRAGRRWSIAEQEALAAACRRHDIEIIPEIDIPGHFQALAHYLRDDDTVRPETRLGVVTRQTTMRADELPRVLGMYGELAGRFGCRAIHMGGDEARGYEGMRALVTTVCAWAAVHALDVLAWDEVLAAGKYQVDDGPPCNLIVHRWRRTVSAALLRQCRVIISWGMYLDHCLDPYILYGRPWAGAVRSAGVLEGAIACTWTELVTQRTLLETIFPALYMLAEGWRTYPLMDADVFGLLRRLCERHGYPPAKPQVQHVYWRYRTRRWCGFYRDDPRSTTSVEVDTLLTRHQDLYAVWSEELVRLGDILWRTVGDGLPPVTPAEQGEARQALAIAYGAEVGAALHEAMRARRGWRKKAADAIRASDRSLLYNNGVDVLLRRLLPKARSGRHVVSHSVLP